MKKRRRFIIRRHIERIIEARIEKYYDWYYSDKSTYGS